MILTAKWNAAQGLSVTEIFAADGEEGFREKETEMLARLSPRKRPRP